MSVCPKCKKKFIETSWTRDRKWRAVCPRCIVEMLETLEGLLKKG